VAAAGARKNPAFAPAGPQWLYGGVDEAVLERPRLLFAPLSLEMAKEATTELRDVIDRLEI
jgi:hypothetical protein